MVLLPHRQDRARVVDLVGELRAIMGAQEVGLRVERGRTVLGIDPEVGRRGVEMGLGLGDWVTGDCRVGSGDGVRGCRRDLVIEGTGEVGVGVDIEAEFVA